MYKILRRGTGRNFALCAVALSLIVCVYYASQSQSPLGGTSNVTNDGVSRYEGGSSSSVRPELDRVRGTRFAECPEIVPGDTDIDTNDVFEQFDFQPSWMRSREYWDDSFEERYANLKKDDQRMPLKVFLVPHSHTDPGWLKTFEQYFHSSTRGILNNMVTKLQQWPNMTFIWSEVSFLSLWWESAHPTKKRAVKKLIKEGRLEMTTGGWVMTDEATCHIYAMLDQLIEGHQWLKTNLDVSPESGWSVDPFGHGATVPYLLKSSGLSGTVIQRIHYAWKQWFAKKQYGDFIWRQPWDRTGSKDMLVHNQPFDIYSIKHSCGPHPRVCLNFDFRKITGEYTEYSVRAVDVTRANLKQMAELLLEQYARTGSLFPHNVVLMPLGDDFRYDQPIEWDQQYTNYKTLMDFINERKDEYKAEVVFGTPKDYFREIEKRSQRYPTLKGDFFVYSDIFSEGHPAYWSGYFTTRPYMKILDRKLEGNLRSAEILFTLAFNNAKRSSRELKSFETYFEKLVKARRNLALFQHHDGITGTSKSFVMKDYALKLFESITDATSVQTFAVQSLIIDDKSKDRRTNYVPTYVIPESDRDSYDKLPKNIPIIVEENETRQVILFNSLAQPRREIITIRVTTHRVRMLDRDFKSIPYQIIPRINATGSIARDLYEIMFLAELEPLAIVVYHVRYDENIPEESLSTIYCNRCPKDSLFTVKPTQIGDVQLENGKLKLLFDGQMGFLKTVGRKSSGKRMQCEIQFAAYPSAQLHSGAYLFMPDPNLRDTEKDVLGAYTPNQKMTIVSGPIASRLTVEYGKLLSHRVTVYHVDDPILAEGIFIENLVDFETPPKNRETEMFMRIQTDIVNEDPPVFYTDLNGHQMLERRKVERIGIEGNYYPITTMAYIEDAKTRLSLIVDHAQGAASYQPGWLEVMLDRRTLYDDSRGMGEGLLDNRKTLFEQWLFLEDFVGDKRDSYSRPSLFANRASNALNYPVNVYLLSLDANERDTIKLRPETRLLTRTFPCDVHLLNLRTNNDRKLSNFPSNEALMVLHRQGYGCSLGSLEQYRSNECPLSNNFTDGTSFFDLEANITRTSLTGTKPGKRLIQGMREINLSPMEVETYELRFV